MISFPPFRLDSTNKCLWKCAVTGVMQKQALAPRAFDILELLIRNAGQLVTHEGLLNALWPNQWVQPEVIKTHVSAIRSVLEDNPRQPKFIETHRSRGYRFIAEIAPSESDRPLARPTENIVMPTTDERARGRRALREAVAVLERLANEPCAKWAIEDMHGSDHLMVDCSPRSEQGHQPARLTVIVRYLADDDIMTARPASEPH